MNVADTINQTEWYTIEVKSTEFILPVRYQNVKYKGHGVFGVVVSADDTVLNRRVAIKKLLRPFQCPIHAQRTYRELQFLIYLNHPDAQVVQLYNVFTPERAFEKFRSLYLVFNFVPYNLDQVIKRKIHFTENHIQQIIYSLLRGLKFIHSGDIIHRDIKPVNIGVDEDSNITILDFGLARAISDGIQTGYVSTRWWRAPEVFLSWERYNEKLDIWSVGCVMAELILLTAIFKGEDYIDQLRKMLSIIGTPSPQILQELCEPNAFSRIMEIDRFPKADYKELFGYKYDLETGKRISGISDEGIDFLNCLLTFDHRSRATLNEALSHPFLANYHDLDAEPTSRPVLDEHKDAKYSIDSWKLLTWELIQNFQPPAFIHPNVANVDID